MDLGTISRVLRGILEQVGEDLIKADRVGIDRRRTMGSDDYFVISKSRS